MVHHRSTPHIAILNIPRREQLTMLWQMMQQPHTLYWRLRGESLNHHDLNHQLTQVLAADGYQDPAGIQQVIMDEIDRAEPQALLNMLQQYVQRQSHCRLVLMSRALPLTILRDPSLRPYVVWQAPSSAVHLIYNQMVLEVQTLGAAWVQVNGLPILDWEGELPRHLFFYLIHHPQAQARQIQQVLWSADEQGNLNRLLNAVNHRLRAVLGGHFVRYRHDKYRRLNNIHIDYDVLNFQKLLTENCNARTPQERIDLLEKALQLYRGDFLPMISAEWAVRVRADLAERYHQALVWLGELYLAMGNREQAVRYLLRAVYHQPQHSQSNALLMQAYLMNKDRRRVLEIYHRYLEAIPYNQMPDDTLQQLAVKAEEHGNS